MKLAFVIAFLAFMLTACVGGSPAKQEQQNANAASSSSGNMRIAAAPVLRSAKGAMPAVNPAVPSSELTPDVLFKLLSAEIADQRGNWQTAYVALLSVAQQTRDPRVARRAAEIAWNAKRVDEALAAVRLWRSIAPQSDDATQFYLGLIMLGNNLAEARPVLEQRLKDEPVPTRGAVMSQFQRLLAQAKDKAAAFAILDAVVSPYKPAVDAHIALAQGASAAGNSARAIQEARAALAVQPGSERAVLTLALVTEDKKEAAKGLADFLVTNPKSRDVRLAYSRLLVADKQYQQAQQEFKVLLKSHPQDLTVLYALGALSLQARNLDESEYYFITYLKVLAAKPDETRDPTQALLALAQIAEERKDTPAALKWLDQIDPSAAAYLNSQIKRAQMIAKGGNLPAARQLLSDIKPDAEAGQVQLIVADSQLLRDANRTDEALVVLSNGLKRFPENTDLLYDYAMAAEKLDKLEPMETALRKIIKLAPTNQHAYNALGYSLAERNTRLPEAVVLIEKAHQLAPQDPFIMDSLGWVRFRMGKLDEAEQYLRKAFALRPDAEIAAHLGEVLWTKGQKDEAKKFWRDANTKDPKNDTLKSTLARLQVSL